MRVRDEDVAAVRLALGLAEAAAAAGEVPIGAVVLGADGRLLGSGGNDRQASYDPTAHAEMRAIREAAAARSDWRLTGCTLAVTLEPCPMCAGAAWLARVDRVVFGAWNPSYGAAGSVWDLLRDGRLDRRTEVVAGVLEAECSALVGAFFRARR